MIWIKFGDRCIRIKKYQIYRGAIADIIIAQQHCVSGRMAETHHALFTYSDGIQTVEIDRI